MNRLLVAAVAVLALAGVMVEEASALTSATRRCISRERANYREALRDSRQTLLSQFRVNYRSCFGPGSDCAKICQDKQIADQDTPNKQRQTCINDNDLTGADNPSFEACDDKFNAAVAVCNAIVDDVAAANCARNARLDRFACTQDCAAAVQPALDQINFEFNECIQACASKP